MLQQTTIAIMQYTYMIAFTCFLNQAHAWFLEIAFVWNVGMCVCVCVSAPGLLKAIHMK